METAFVLNSEMRPASGPGLRGAPWLRQRQTGARKKGGSGLYCGMGQVPQGLGEGMTKR